MTEGSRRAASIGWQVDVSQACSGSVHSVFPGAVNCLVDGHLWTVLPATAPDAPFGLRLDGGVLPGGLGARPGDLVHGRPGYLAVGPAVLDCRSASRWVPGPLGPLRPGWPERFDQVGRQAAPSAWAGSAELAAAVVDALLERPGSATLQGVVTRVVGCGPGLTPAGDDVLAGLLAGLWLAVLDGEHRTRGLPCQPGHPGHVSHPRHRGHRGHRGHPGHRDHRDRPDHADRGGPGGLRSRLVRAAAETPSRTTDISRHLLGQAAAAWFGAALHGLLGTLAGTDARALGPAVDAMLATGASSGADTCVGVAACGPLLSGLIPEGNLP